MRIRQNESGTREARRALLTRLRAEMQAVSMLPSPAADVWTLGEAQLDAAVAGLSAAALHEAAPESGREAGAAAGFAVALALRRLAALPGAEPHRPVFWCARRDGLQEAGALSGRGLARLGADPGGFLLAAARRDADVLWALEEAVRSGAVALAVGEMTAADLVATRRLSLAAREHGVPALLLRTARGLGPSAARSRWRIAAAPSRPERFAPHAPGVPRWRVALEKGFVERPQEWIVEWDHATHRLRLSAALADRAAESRPAALLLPFARTG